MLFWLPMEMSKGPRFRERLQALRQLVPEGALYTQNNATGVVVVSESAQNFVPVTDGRGMFCGIITRSDVINQLRASCTKGK